MSPEAKNAYVINKAMEIIMNSGDARNLAAEAFTLITTGDYDGAAEKLKEAEKVQAKAHIIQTEMIQGDIRGGNEKMNYSVLFAHAQDTLMSIQVEINMTKKFLKYAKAIEARLDKQDLKKEV